MSCNLRTMCGNKTEILSEHYLSFQFYYLQPTYQRFLSPKVPPSPLEQRNIRVMVQQPQWLNLKIQHNVLNLIKLTKDVLPFTKAMLSPLPTLFFTLLTNLLDTCPRFTHTVSFIYTTVYST